MLSEKIIIKELLSMGYRSIGGGFYAKPLGKSILVFNVKDLRVKQMFNDLQDGLNVWDSKIFVNDEDASEGDLVKFIAFFEEFYVRTKKSCGITHEFLTPEQEFGFIL